MVTYRIVREDNGNLLFTPRTVPVIEGLKDSPYLYDQYDQFAKNSECIEYGKNKAYHNKNNNEIMLIIEDRTALPKIIFGYDFTNEFEREIKSHMVVTRGYAYYKIVE